MIIKISRSLLYLLVLSIVFSSGCSTLAQDVGTNSPSIPMVQEEPVFISENEVSSDNQNETAVANLNEIISFLTGMSDRITGSDNNAAASRYIAEYMKEIGLEPFVQDIYDWPYMQSIDGEDVTVQNVVGYIEGSEGNQAIVVSCHLDTVKNTPGAVDNASGVAAMLLTAGVLTAQKDSLKDDVIFCAFNGEEQSYAGSKAFVDAFQGMYENACNINYDSVGMINGGDYMFGVAPDDVGFDLNTSIRPFLDDHSISYGGYPVSGVRSDHISFHNAEIPNVNFTQSGILSVTHSPNDTIEHLEIEQIETLTKAVTEYILLRQEK